MYLRSFDSTKEVGESCSKTLLFATRSNSFRLFVYVSEARKTSNDNSFAASIISIASSYRLQDVTNVQWPYSFATIFMSSKEGAFETTSLYILLANENEINMAQHSSLISEIIAPVSIPSRALGVTSFLKMKMQGNTPFRVDMKLCPARRPNVNHKRDQGLKNGRFTDHLFRRIIEKRERLNPTNRSHCGIVHVLRLLRENNIIITNTQVPVWDEDLEIKTILDGIGYSTKANQICVFELKSTTFTVEEHIFRYNRRCSNRPMLVNGMINCERNMHALQTAFGMFCVKEMTKKTACGVVVVVCSNGAKLYHVDKGLAIREAFGNLTRVPMVPTVQRQPTTKFVTLPSKSTSAYKDLFQTIVSAGYTSLRPCTKETINCSGVAEALSKRGTFIAAVGIISGRSHKSTRDKHVAMLNSDCRKLWLASKRKSTVSALLIVPGNNGFNIRRIGKTFHPQ